VYSVGRGSSLPPRGSPESPEYSAAAPEPHHTPSLFRFRLPPTMCGTSRTRDLTVVHLYWCVVGRRDVDSWDCVLRDFREPYCTLQRSDRTAALYSCPFPSPYGSSTPQLGNTLYGIRDAVDRPVIKFLMLSLWTTKNN